MLVAWTRVCSYDVLSAGGMIAMSAGINEGGLGLLCEG